MEKETNISPQQINSFLQQLKNSSYSEESAEKALESSLDEAQLQKVKGILQDKEKLAEILSSPFARAILEKFKKEP